MQAKIFIRPVLVAASLLLVPLIAMQFTNEVNWDLLDFVVAGFLLLSAGVLYEFVASKIGNTPYRVALFIVVTAALLLIWVNLAVGIF